MENMQINIKNEQKMNKKDQEMKKYGKNRKITHK